MTAKREHRVKTHLPSKKHPDGPARLRVPEEHAQQEAITRLQNRVGNRNVHRLLSQQQSLLQMQGNEERTPLVNSTHAMESAGNAALAQAIDAGVRDQNKLTDLVFHARHPHEQGRKIDPQNDAGLVAEWKTILEQQIKPALEKAEADSKSEPDQHDEEKPSAARLSGAHWVKQYPTSQVTDTLIDPFKQNVESFIRMLESNGASISIGATYRPRERAYLMHYAWLIANGKLKYGAYPTNDPYGINIVWDHGSEEVSRAAAREMVSGYRMAHPAALKSRHTEGRAIDMTITGLPKNLNISDKITLEIGSAPAAANRALWRIAAKYFSVHKLPKDPPHWSEDGR